MPDILVAYIGLTIGIIVGWLKFLPTIKDKTNIYKLLNIVSLFFMVISYFPYANFIEIVDDSLAIKHLACLFIYIIVISILMCLFIRYHKRFDI